MKKIITLLLSFAIILPTFTHAADYSDWAAKDINFLIYTNVMPQDLQTKDLTKPITRKEFCYLAVNMYKYLTGNNSLPSGTAFKDTSDKTIVAANSLGIMSGYDDGAFYPNRNITRQEMSAVIYRTLNLCKKDFTNYDSTVLHKFSDRQDVAIWAYDSLSACVLFGIMQGTSETLLSPIANATREQAAVIVSRCLATNFNSSNPYDTLGCDVSGDVDFVKFEDRALTVSWKKTADVYVYDINLFLSADNFWYSNSDVYVQTLYSDTESVTFKNLRAGKKYLITIDGKSADGTVLKSYRAYAFPQELYTLDEKEKIVFGNGEITSKAQADTQMTQITVNAWKINSNGIKYPSTLTLTVHRNIADVTQMAFEEIFNGEEKFPFKDAGAYAWRDSMSSGRYSHHNYGTAIDLNYNENYCLYKNGSFTGLYWKPGEDSYSIPPNGEVVSIFAKYGFKWGGDEWSNPKDYMHFSYLEL